MTGACVVCFVCLCLSRKFCSLVSVPFLWQRTKRIEVDIKTQEVAQRAELGAAQQEILRIKQQVRRGVPAEFSRWFSVCWGNVCMGVLAM